MNLFFLVFFLMASFLEASSPNQTNTTTPVKFSDSLSFEISVELANFSLPNGLQSFVAGSHGDKWLFLAGRTNGLHDFSNTTHNFPPRKQNTTVYVVDFNNHTVHSKSLRSDSSGLTGQQIDTLSVTAAQFKQVQGTLYVVGGYGVDSATGGFSTKPTLTAIDVPGLMHWVEDADKGETAAQYIRQISHPLLQVTGGYLDQANPHTPFLLIFGQNFPTFYLDSSNGFYTQQVRSFNLVDEGDHLAIIPNPSEEPLPAYRRRDLNVVPIIQKKENSYESSFVALSGVFTQKIGVWTVPVLIDAWGNSSMADPSKPSTFKQGMNNYSSATLQLFSKKANQMHMLILGGISFITYKDGVFTKDTEFPFTNNITDVCIDSQGQFAQYLMDAEYPVIPSTFANLGNPLLFGSTAQFIPLSRLLKFPNGVISLDDLEDNAVLGYVVGGIASTVPNTEGPSDSIASSYIFQVKLNKR